MGFQYDDFYFRGLERELKKGSSFTVSLDDSRKEDIFRAFLDDGVSRSTRNNGYAYRYQHTKYGITILTALQKLVNPVSYLPLPKAFKPENTSSIVTPHMIEGNIDLLKGTYVDEEFIIDAYKSDQLLFGSNGGSIFESYCNLRSKVIEQFGYHVGNRISDYLISGRENQTPVLDGSNVISMGKSRIPNTGVKKD